MSNSKSAPTMANSNGGQQRQQHQQECCSAAAFAQSQCFCKTNGQQQQQQPHNQQQQQRNGPVGHRPRQPTATVSLNSMQVERLRSVLDQEVQIHGRENFPTLEIPLHTLILNVRRKLREHGLPLKHVKLNGGAASFVFAQSDSFAYSDVDLIFPLDLTEDQDFERVREAVFDALLEMMPSSANKAAITAECLRDVYIRKMVKVTDGDRWSLFSLHNDYGRCIELKFVERMRRNFEFSVDSFQITLDPLIDQPNEHRPIVRAESMYGDFMQALYHLNKRLIDTRNPEEIRGGGLLKYCHLLTRGFSATANCRDMEKYMCSRFFIDFPDISVQEMKLLNYLQNHFGNEDELKYEYLHKLFCVIRDSTVCLMYHERRQTLAMVDRLRQQLSYNLMLYYQQFEGANSSNAQYYGNQGRPRRYNSNNSRHWHNNNGNRQQLNGGHNGYNNRHNNGPMLCVSPVSTIASSSLLEEELPTAQSPQLAAAPDGQQQSAVEESGANSANSAVAKEKTAAPTPTIVILQPSHKQQSQQKSTATSTQQQQPPPHIPRQTLLYLPPNASHWIPVV